MDPGGARCRTGKPCAPRPRASSSFTPVYLGHFTRVGLGQGEGLGRGRGQLASPPGHLSPGRAVGSPEPMPSAQAGIDALGSMAFRACGPVTGQRSCWQTPQVLGPVELAGGHPPRVVVQEGVRVGPAQLAPASTTTQGPPGDPGHVRWPSRCAGLPRLRGYLSTVGRPSCPVLATLEAGFRSRPFLPVGCPLHQSSSPPWRLPRAQSPGPGPQGVPRLRDTMDSSLWWWQLGRPSFWVGSMTAPGQRGRFPRAVMLVPSGP